MLLGDEVAALLLRYSAMLITSHTADTVCIRALTMSGDKIDVEYLLGGGAAFMSQSSFSPLPERDNAVAERRMTDEMALLRPEVAAAFDPDSDLLALHTFSYEP